MPVRRGAGPAGLAVAPPPASSSASGGVGGIGSGRNSRASAPATDLSSAAGPKHPGAPGGTTRPSTGSGSSNNSHRASPASVASSNASVTSASAGSSRVVTASRRGRGMRPGDRAVAVRSPSPTGTGSGNVSAMASPIVGSSASSRHSTPQVSPSRHHHSLVSTAKAAAVAATASEPTTSGAEGQKPATGTGNAAADTAADGPSSASGSANKNAEKKKEASTAAVQVSPGPTSSSRYPVITIGGGGGLPMVAQSPKATIGSRTKVDPHDQITPKHNHLSARQAVQVSARQQQADYRPPSPIQGPSSAAAAAAAAAKALSSGQGMMMRNPPSAGNGGGSERFNGHNRGRDDESDHGPGPESDDASPPHGRRKHQVPPSHRPHPFPYGGYQPHAIPHSPDDDGGAAAAYYASMYGHHPYGGYYNPDMTTNWPDEVEGSERSASADSDDRGSSKKAAEAAYRHFDERDRAYLQYHRQHQLHQHHQQQQPHHYYQHHSEHHRGFHHHPGDGGGPYLPPPHVANEYIPPNEGSPEGDVDGSRKRGSAESKNGGKVVMGGASPIHVARGMSTSPLAQNNTLALAAGRHVTPQTHHTHKHNTRHSSRRNMKEEQPTPSLSASSIFRGRPGPTMSSRAADDFDDDDEDSPQRILLSLSKGDSFEDKGFGAAAGSGKVQVVGGDGAGKSADNVESSSSLAPTDAGASTKKGATKGGAAKKKKATTKKSKAAAASSGIKSGAAAKKAKPPSKGSKKKTTPKCGGKTPSSPEGPPRIQHSFSQNTKRGNDPFYFDPMRTPNGKIAMLDPQGPMIDNAPSFAPFFNTSFDSLGDPSKLAMSMSGGLGISPSFSFGLGVANAQATHPDDGARSGPYPMANNSLRLSFGPSFGDQQHPVSAPVPAAANATKTMVLGGDPNAGMRNVTDAAAIVLSGTSSGDGGAGSSVERLRSSSTTSSPSRRSTVGSVKEFYDILKSHKLAFVECAFLLPGLKEALAETSEATSTEKDEVNSSPLPVRGGSDSPDRGAGGYTTSELPRTRVISVGVTPARPQTTRTNFSGRRHVSELAISRRRVKSAICAFGGSGYTITSGAKEEDDSTANGVSANSASIFRTKKGEDKQPSEATTSMPPESDANVEEGPQSDARKNYDAKLLARFYENNNRLTWEVEDESPISLHSKGESKKRNHPGARDTSDRDAKKLRPHTDSSAAPPPAKGKLAFPSVPTAAATSAGAPAVAGSPQAKMKYRCKLCGQPKQNHVCPYKKSLQRSIGTMVYSAVNAYNAEEPGELAPALSSMNNFVSVSGAGNKLESSSAASTPSRGGPRPLRSVHPESVERKLAHITPQSVRVGTTSPGGSSLSTLGSPPRGRGPLPPRSSGISGSRRSGGGGARASGMRFPSIASSGSSLSGGGNFLFVEPSEVRPEQFRAVGPLPKTEDTPYQYASLPLPYGQRKRLSDKLFGISKEVPDLTDECAHVLREAREKDMWDRAIAELLTQILVVLDCSPDDRKLEGIRRHLLLHHGIAC